MTKHGHMRSECLALCMSAGRTRKSCHCNLCICWYICKALATLTWQNMDKQTEHTYPMSIVFCSVSQATSGTLAYVLGKKQLVQQKSTMAVYARKALHARPEGIARSLLFVCTTIADRAVCVLQCSCALCSVSVGQKQENRVDLSECSPCDKSKTP